MFAESLLVSCSKKSLKVIAVKQKFDNLCRRHRPFLKTVIGFLLIGQLFGIILHPNAYGTLEVCVASHIDLRFPVTKIIGLQDPKRAIFVKCYKKTRFKTC